MVQHFLLLDTSLSGLTLGIVRRRDSAGSEVLLASAIHPVRNEAFTGLSLFLQKMCSQAQIHPFDIAGIVLGQGPGSFTGIRIGMAFAQGLMSAHEIMTGKTMFVKGISSLAALGLTYWAKELGQKRQLVLFPSTHTHAYAALVGTDEKGQAKMFTPGQLLEIKDLNEKLGVFAEATLGLMSITLVENAIASFAMALQEKEIVFTVKSPEEILSDLLHALKASIGNDFPLGFQKDLPQANYARLSTAEERMTK